MSISVQGNYYSVVSFAYDGKYSRIRDGGWQSFICANSLFKVEGKDWSALLEASVSKKAVRAFNNHGKHKENGNVSIAFLLLLRSCAWYL